MRVILKENIDNLGKKGDIVNVAVGYGRNYLIPRKMALEVTATNLKMIEQQQQMLKKKLEKDVESFKSIVEKLNAVSLAFSRKTAEKDVIFGSVSTSDIKESLDGLGFEIEKKRIILPEPLKRLGNYTVPVKVFQEHQAEIRVEVVKEGAEGEEEKVPEGEKIEEEAPAGDSSEEPITGETAEGVPPEDSTGQDKQEGKDSEEEEKDSGESIES